ncbi:hypothetical protein PR048_025995 [Dryococelus australis]|uniref:Uncharacterized protein n=1 Tax=Dryococelus australis TaxID=614101 RepID=A0ABQ9GK25_9NEOP|nr:hypothetical protein PR048_025995 [Dryococelus australis]
MLKPHWLSGKSTQMWGHCSSVGRALFKSRARALQNAAGLCKRCHVLKLQLCPPHTPSLTRADQGWRCKAATALSSALKEMFKIPSISTNTCINPPLHGHPDALMNPWKVPDCFATRHNTGSSGTGMGLPITAAMAFHSNMIHPAGHTLYVMYLSRAVVTKRSVRGPIVVMNGRGRRMDIPEKTRRPPTSSGTISTCENLESKQSEQRLGLKERVVLCAGKRLEQRLGLKECVLLCAGKRSEERLRLKERVLLCAGKRSEKRLGLKECVLCAGKRSEERLRPKERVLLCAGKRSEERLRPKERVLLCAGKRSEQRLKFKERVLLCAGKRSEKRLRLKECVLLCAGKRSEKRLRLKECVLLCAGKRSEKRLRLKERVLLCAGKRSEQRLRLKERVLLCAGKRSEKRLRLKECVLLCAGKRSEKRLRLKECVLLCAGKRSEQRLRLKECVLLCAGKRSEKRLRLKERVLLCAGKRSEKRLRLKECVLLCAGKRSEQRLSVVDGHHAGRAVSGRRSSSIGCRSLLGRRSSVGLVFITCHDPVRRRDGNTARLARRSDEALEVCVSVARIAPSLLDLERAAPSHSNRNLKTKILDTCWWVGANHDPLPRLADALSITPRQRHSISEYSRVKELFLPPVTPTPPLSCRDNAKEMHSSRTRHCLIHAVAVFPFAIRRSFFYHPELSHSFINPIHLKLAEFEMARRPAAVFIKLAVTSGMFIAPREALRERDIGRKQYNQSPRRASVIQNPSLPSLPPSLSYDLTTLFPSLPLARARCKASLDHQRRLEFLQTAYVRRKLPAEMASIKATPRGNTPWIKFSASNPLRLLGRKIMQGDVHRGKEGLGSHGLNFGAMTTTLSIYGEHGKNRQERPVCLLASHLDYPGSIPGRATPDSRMWESCRTMPLVGGFFRRPPVPPPPNSFRRCSMIASITHIGSQDFDVSYVTLLKYRRSRRATSCGYDSSHPVWHALYECLQDIHGDSSPFLLQPFHELSIGFWLCLTSPHPVIQFVPKMFYRVEVGALGWPVQSANIVVGVPLNSSP